MAFAAAIAVFPFGRPNGDRPALPAGGSIGDVLVVEEPDLGWFACNWGRWLRLRWCSGFGDGAIMYYYFFFSIEERPSAAVERAPFGHY